MTHRKEAAVAALAGAGTALILIVIIGAVSVHAVKNGRMTLIDEHGRAIGFAAEEPKETPETEAQPLSEEERVLLNETPAQTEAELSEAEAAPGWTIEPAEELMFTENLMIESRSQGDPFAAMGDGTDDALTFWTDAIPDYYDGNDRNGEDVVTEVRNQGKSNLCWAYAALGAIESNLLIKHPTLGADKLDLSEKHLAYYVMNPTGGSTGGLIDRDYREVQRIDSEKSQVLDAGLGYVMSGGVTNFVTAALAAWKGPVDDKSIDSFERERNGRISIKEQGVPSAAYGGDYHVQGVYEIPGAEYDRDAIKKMILNFGAVTASVHADTTRGNSYWFLSNLYDGDPYGENNNLSDHEVLVVGWDDLYETDNFNPESIHEGAWFCRNSWGATSGEEGYFWLSYDDVIFNNNTVAAYSAAFQGDPDFYDRNYQAAGLLTHVTDMMIDQNNMIYALSATQNPYGMLYTAEGDESLAAVSLFAMETENEYTIEIYQNPDISADGSVAVAALDNPAVSQSVRSATGGYHTYALDSELALAAGDRFFILVKPSKPSKLVYEKAMIGTGDANQDSDYGYVGNVFTNAEASGFSFYPSEDGTALVPQGDRDFFVKAFTRLR
ncbi:MAG: hypothetical protein K6G16_02320 [Lachnospiraceae bacterium]|nr:hypothetical protein [Lachnospiraceae bacterium]